MTNLDFFGAAEMRVDGETVALEGTKQHGVLTIGAMLLTILLACSLIPACRFVDRLLPFKVPGFGFIMLGIAVVLIIGIWKIAAHPFPGRRVFRRETLADFIQQGRAVSMKVMFPRSTAWQSFIVFTPDEETAGRLRQALIYPPESPQAFAVTMQPMAAGERHAGLCNTGLVRIEGTAITLHGGMQRHFLLIFGGGLLLVLLVLVGLAIVELITGKSYRNLAGIVVMPVIFCYFFLMITRGPSGTVGCSSLTEVERFGTIVLVRLHTDNGRPVYDLCVVQDEESAINLEHALQEATAQTAAAGG